jgi:hypothetical protein
VIGGGGELYWGPQRGADGAGGEAFTNLELATGIGRSRELDLIMMTDHLSFLVNLKDWSGTIESDSRNWLHNGCDTGPSPVAKIHSNVKDVLCLLTTQ